MKTIIRSLFGVLSSLLLAVGFARAAEKLDPVSQALRTQTSVTKVAPDSVQYCNLLEDGS